MTQGLGSPPADPHDDALWSEERRGALVLLAALADHDPALLRGAANLRAQECESINRARVVARRGDSVPRVGRSASPRPRVPPTGTGAASRHEPRDGFV